MKNIIVDSSTRLIEIIENDFKNLSRFPVRFVFVNGFLAWRELFTYFSNVFTIYELSDACRGKDTIPDRDIVFSKVRDLLTNNNSVTERIALLPVAEVLRIRRDAFPIRELATLQTSQSYSRVIVPLLWPSPSVQEELNMINRYSSGIIPVMEIKSTGINKLQIVSSASIAEKGSKVAHGIREYLEIWEKGGNENVTLVTEQAYNVATVSGDFSVVSFCNAFDRLSRISNFGLIEQHWGSESNWQWLLDELNGRKNLSEFIFYKLNMNTYNAEKLVHAWSSFDADHQWLALLWAKVENVVQEDIYNSILQKTEEPNLFRKVITLLPFHQHLTLDDISLRTDLMLHLKIRHLDQDFWHMYSDLEDLIEMIRVLPGVGERDTIEILKNVSGLIKANTPKHLWLQIVERTHRDLYTYLTYRPFVNPLVVAYMRSYVYSKACDTLLPELSQVEEESQTQNFYCFQTRNAVLEEEIPSGGKVYWIDALGLEWAPLLQRKLQSNGLKVEIRIARASLPTITSENEIMNGKFLSNTLDKIAHDQPYGSFPIAFNKQFKAISDFASKITQICSSEDRVLLTSDHGLTRFASKQEKIAVPEGYKSDFRGRFAEMITEGFLASETNKSWLVDNKRIILRGHNIFVGGNRASGETHGGASIEESLVPVFVVSKIDDIPLEITSYTREVELSLKEDTYIKLVLSSSRITSVMLKIKTMDITLHGRKEKPLCWVFTSTSISPGVYDMEVISTEGLIGCISVQISKGYKENDLGL